MTDAYAQPTSLRRTSALDEQLCFALYAATNAVTRAYRPKLAQIGLTYPQYLIMLALWHRGPQTVSELAAQVRLPANALSLMLERMAAGNLLHRRRCAADRRVSFIELTESGRALEHRVAQVQDDIVCELALTPEERDRLRADLVDLIRRLAAAAPPPTTAPAAARTLEPALVPSDAVA